MNIAYRYTTLTLLLTVALIWGMTVSNEICVPFGVGVMYKLKKKKKITDPKPYYSNV